MAGHQRLGSKFGGTLSTSRTLDRIVPQPSCHTVFLVNAIYRIPQAPIHLQQTLRDPP